MAGNGTDDTTTTKKKKTGKVGRKKADPTNTGGDTSKATQASAHERGMVRAMRQHHRERFHQMRQLYEIYPWLSPQSKQLPSKAEMAEVEAAGSVVSAIVLIDAALGMIPGVTASQRLDAAKQLQKQGDNGGGNDNPQDIASLLRQHGRAGLTDTIQQLRHEKDNIQQGQPAGEPSHKRRLE